jgi:GDP-L-fucose synthase
MLLKGANILVTGGSGFLGKFVVQTLTSQGAHVFTASRSTGFDLRNEPEALSSVLLAKPDTIVHLAANTNLSAGRPVSVFQDNLLMSMHMIGAAVKAPARLIMVGCPSWLCWDAVTHLCNAYRIQHELAYVHLVPPHLYGPFDRTQGDVRPVTDLISRVVAGAKGKQKEVVCAGPVEREREILFVQDMAQAVLHACANIGHRDDPIFLPAHKVSSGKLVEETAALCKYSGKVKWNGDAPMDLPSPIRITPEATKKILGWAPGEGSFEEGLKLTVECFLGKGK